MLESGSVRAFMGFTVLVAAIGGAVAALAGWALWHFVLSHVHLVWR